MTARPHRKVFIAWGRWWAFQFVRGWDVSLGVSITWHRPLVDLYAGPFTLALGLHPEITLPWEAQRFGCRGFFIGRPIL